MLTQTQTRRPKRDDGLWVVGHRGAAGLKPENTLASFARAVDLGVDAIELDVHLTADQHLVVIHDARVDRTTSDTGEVSAMTLDGIKRLDAGDGERIPTLDEVLGAVPVHVAVNIELKGRHTAAPVARAIRSLDRPILVSAFDPAELVRFHALCPTVPCAPLLARWHASVLHAAREVSAWSVNLADRIAEPRLVHAVRRAGYRCLVYTVNDPVRARSLRADGVFGVFSDFPDRLLG